MTSKSKAKSKKKMPKFFSFCATSLVTYFNKRISLENSLEKKSDLNINTNKDR